MIIFKKVLWHGFICQCINIWEWHDFIFADIKYISMKYIVHQKLLFSKVLLLFLFTQTKSVLCSHSGLFSSFFSLLSFLLTKKSFQKVWKRRRTYIIMTKSCIVVIIVFLIRVFPEFQNLIAYAFKT